MLIYTYVNDGYYIEFISIRDLSESFGFYKYPVEIEAGNWKYRETFASKCRPLAILAQ